MVELMGLNKWAFTLFEYGERWRTHRRLSHEFFNIASVGRYDEDQRKAASKLLKNLSEHPADFHHHVQLATGSLALSITYGIRVDSAENPYFHAAEEAIEAIQAALIPGAFPVEFLPFRKSQRSSKHHAKFNSLGSSPFSIVDSWRRRPELRGTRLQVLVEQHNVANAIRHRTTKGTLLLHP